MKEKMFSKDFILVLIGQIISLFGNQIVHFALPLYLLHKTGSAALFGIISACAFIPMILLCPIGGIIADRVNKRNIMVALDFTTAIVIGGFCILTGEVDVIALVTVAMILLYGIQGAYQPAVQASIPALVKQEHNMQANAIINLVNSLSGLIGPVLGGTLYSLVGLMPILYISVGCFAFSATMEIFIKIPFTKKNDQGSIIAIGIKDLKESFHFIRKEQPAIFKVSLLIAAINMLLSALVIIGLPVLITQYMDFTPERANRYYGYAQGAIAAGSLVGGLSAGVFAKKLKAVHAPIILAVCVLTLLPMGLALQLCSSSIVTYIIIMICCIVMMATAALFSIQMMSFLQILTPQQMVGKVISCAMCIGMCASPIGQAMYGVLFQKLLNTPYILFYSALLVTGLVCIFSAKSFKSIDEAVKQKN